jgi:hypothetical protein
MTIDPTLDQVPEAAKHRVACLLEPETRRKLWKELREGTAPMDARADVMKDAPPPEVAEVAEESGEGRPAGTAEERSL